MSSHGGVIWEPWKVKSSNWAGEDNQNSKYLWIGSDVTIFPLLVPLDCIRCRLKTISALTQNSRRSRILAQRMGKGSPNTWRRRSLHFFHLFPLFLTPAFKPPCDSSSSNSYEMKTLKDENFPFQSEKLWSDESDQISVIFSFLNYHCSNVATVTGTV